MHIRNKTINTLWELSKNDFANRFAGSVFGIVWAFIQPLVLISMYLFIFLVAFPATPVDGKYPYVLWLVSGLIPWLFFSEAVVNSTNCLLEYSYLVKKIVFPIKIIPFVKIISSLFVHLFFLIFTFVVCFFVRSFSGLYCLQLLYYLACVVLLASGIGFITSSILAFFRDFMPIINIFMQVGMWMTPILWDVDILKDKNYVLWIIMKANPMAYIVQGYRESFLGVGFFWDHPVYTAYFLTVLVIVCVLGIISFKKMKHHFADVL